MSGADEFSMEEASLVLLRSHRRKIERLFGVSLSHSQSGGRFDGLPADTRYHWLKLTGGDGDRKSAREYINSLCYPEEKQFLTNSTNTPALNDITFLEETEKQTKSYIVLDKEKSLISISGSPLAVTLALSIFEDSINQFSKEKKEDNESISPAENGSDLSSAARRLSNCLESALLNFGSKDYNYEDLKPFSESVKRSFLESFSLEINSNDCSIETDGIQFNDLLPKEPINSQKTSEFPVARHQLKENTFDDSEDNLGFNRVSVIKSTAVEMGFSERDIDKVMETAKEPMIPSEILKQLSIISQMQENRMPDSECKTDKNRELPDSYIERLAQDFEEETGNLPVDELKWRNAQRLRCLAEAIEHSDCQSVCSSSSPDVRKADVVDKRELVSEKYKNKKKSNCKSDQLVPPSFNSSPKLGRKKEKTMACNKVKSKKKKTPEVVEAKSYRLPKAAGGIKTNFQRSLNTQSFDEEETCVMVHWTPPGNDAAVYEQQKWMQKVPDEQQMPSKLPPHSSILRYIVVDGSNVAMTHGNGQVFSCRGIQICVEYFLKRGHEVTVFVPHYRMRTPTDRYPMTDQHIMNQLKKDRILVLTPSRVVNKREIVCYDDKYILNLAEKMDGVIVSNDQYRDLMFEKRSWKKIIEERLLMYSFVGDNFMPPEDPLGRYGPNLDSFLCKPWEQRPCDTSRKQERIHGNTRYARQQQYKLINPRSQQETDELFMQLRVIFSEPYQKDIINRILTDHRTIRNVEKLSDLILSAFSPSLV